MKGRTPVLDKWKGEWPMSIQYVFCFQELEPSVPFSALPIIADDTIALWIHVVHCWCQLCHFRGGTWRKLWAKECWKPNDQATEIQIQRGFFSRPKKSQELVNDLYAKGWGRVFSIGGRDYNCFYWRSSFNVFLCVMKSSSVHLCRGSMPSS